MPVAYLPRGDNNDVVMGRALREGGEMLNFNRRDRIPETPEVAKTVLKPAIYEPPGSANAGGGGMPRTPPDASAARPAPTAAPAPAAAPAPKPQASDAPESRLYVGVNIKLKGVEICDCDALVVEGHVEATVHSKALEIAKPGTLKGNVDVDVAEIHGEFMGELMVRNRLTVHGTGRITGTIRYGKLVVADGGEITGDVKRRDNATDGTGSEPAAAGLAGAPVTARATLAPSSERWSN
jgi:cytoskeletal protein CcmA (bactofilin family)